MTGCYPPRGGYGIRRRPASVIGAPSAQILFRNKYER
jgi:hypothetical protein